MKAQGADATFAHALDDRGGVTKWTSLICTLREECPGALVGPPHQTSPNFHQIAAWVL